MSSHAKGFNTGYRAKWAKEFKADVYDVECLRKKKNQVVYLIRKWCLSNACLEYQLYRGDLPMGKTQWMTMSQAHMKNAEYSKKFFLVADDEKQRLWQLKPVQKQQYMKRLKYASIKLYDIWIHEKDGSVSEKQELITKRKLREFLPDYFRVLGID
jgi:hypothetical protein